MERIIELTEKLATAAVAVDPTDLAVLADMHGALKAIEQMATEQVPTGQRDAVRSASSVGEKLVQQVIFNEVADTNAALNNLRSEITKLQQLIASATGEGDSAASTQAANDAIVIDAPTTPVNADDLPLVNEFITESLSHIEVAEAEILKLEDDPENNDTLNAIFRSFHTIKGVAGFLNFGHIGKLAHAAENLLDLARQGKLKLLGQSLDIVLESLDVMKALVVSLDAAVKSNGIPASHPKLSDLIRRLNLTAEGKIGTRASDPKPEVESREETTRAKETTAPAATEAGAPKEARAEAAASSHSSGDATVKVATERLDTLINSVGELVIAQAMVSQDISAAVVGNQRLARNMSQLGKITRELQELSMSMRMVPIAGVFQKMSRLVRDVARKAGKEINLVLTGKETELDRNVVEAISDPLVHMVRNAADHGVEAPDVREQNGKPRCGTIELKAYHHSGNVVIEIIDDGKGLDKARILKKAIANGIVKEGEELSDQDIFKLVFHAGLSTAEKITDISGRGVGMDVVKRNIEGLRGRIDIASTPGKGSVFTIRLPLTLAVIDGLVVKVGSERYILPITSIEQSLRPRPEQMSTVQGRAEMCLIRGRTLPMYRLHKLFNVTPKFTDPTQSLVVIVHDNDRCCCLLVDELLGQEQVVIKSLGESLGHVPGTSGGAILGDGNVSLILDVPGLMNVAEQQV